jgi:hypothetical protein
MRACTVRGCPFCPRGCSGGGRTGDRSRPWLEAVGEAAAVQSTRRPWRYRTRARRRSDVRAMHLHNRAARCRRIHGDRVLRQEKKCAGGAPDYGRRRRSLAGASLASHGGDARDVRSLQEMGNRRNVWQSGRNGSGQKKYSKRFFHLWVAGWVIFFNC